MEYQFKDKETSRKTVEHVARNIHVSCGGEGGEGWHCLHRCRTCVFMCVCSGTGVL